MARKEEFIVTVTPGGEIKVETVGFKGNECTKALKEVGNVVAPDVTPIREEKFPDYYSQKEVEEKVLGETKEK